MTRLGSHDMGEIIKQMEESEFATSYLESEHFLRWKILQNNSLNINTREEEEKRRRRALKVVDDEGLQEDDDV